MRIQSTFEVNTSYQENPFISQNYPIASHGGKSANRSFSEFFLAQIQPNENPVSTRMTKTQPADISAGLQTMLTVPRIQQPMLEKLAY